MNLAKILKRENVFIGAGFEDTESFYGNFSLFLKERGIINNADKVKRLLIKREIIQSTAIGNGAATPHIYSDEFSKFLVSVALLKEGLDFKAPDKLDVYVVFIIMSDDRDIGLHLKTLAHIARLVGNTNLIAEFRNATSEDEILHILTENEKLI